MSKDKYIPTYTKAFNSGDSAHFRRKIREVTTISVIEGLRNKLVVGNIYGVKQQYQEADRSLMTRTLRMECIGIHPHIAVFRPVEGRYRFTVAYSYPELCTGALEGVNELMNGVLPYENNEEELIDAEIQDE